MTAAIQRVVSKAVRFGVVHRAGVFVERPQRESLGVLDVPADAEWLDAGTEDPNRRDRKHTIDRAIALGFLRDAGGFNCYVPTPAGRQWLKERGGAD